MGDQGEASGSARARFAINPSTSASTFLFCAARGVRLEPKVSDQSSFFHAQPRALQRLSRTALFAALFISQWATAQSRETLDAVVVSATRTPIKLDNVIAELTVLDRQTLARSEARSLVEVLAEVPGLQFASNGGLGTASSLFVRGLEARHVLLLVDGVRVGSATLNSPSLDNLPIDLIDRIEIVRGPMSSLYGSNAMGGVVQIFTRKAGAPGWTGHARTTVGSDSYLLGAAGAQFQGERFDFSLQAQHQKTDGFSATNANVPFGSFNADDDGFRQNSLSLNGGWQLAEGWRLSGLLLDSQGRSHYDDGPGADARAELTNRVQSLQLEGTFSPIWQSTLSYGRSLDQYDTQVSASPFATLGIIETDQTQLSWEHRFDLSSGQLLALVERLDQDVSRPEEAYSVSDRHIDGIALGWSRRWGGSDLQLSARRDRNSQFGSHSTGALAYAYSFTPNWRAGASIGNSFTAPSFNQLYFPNFGNPNLQPEEGEHVELFAQWQGEQTQLRLTGFQHRYDLFISAGPLPTNIPQVDIDGVTLSWQANLDALSLGASVDYVDPRNDTTGSSAFGKILPRRAKRALKLQADWQLQQISLGASLQAYSSRFDDTANSRALGGYGVLDLRADWPFTEHWSLGLRLNNATDKRYETVYGYNQAERQALVTLRFSPE